MLPLYSMHKSQLSTCYIQFYCQWLRFLWHSFLLFSLFRFRFFRCCCQTLSFWNSSYWALLRVSYPVCLPFSMCWCVRVLFCVLANENCEWMFEWVQCKCFYCAVCHHPNSSVWWLIADAYADGTIYFTTTDDLAFSETLSTYSDLLIALHFHLSTFHTPTFTL